MADHGEIARASTAALTPPLLSITRTGGTPLPSTTSRERASSIGIAGASCWAARRTSTRLERFVLSQADDALPALEPLRLRNRPISDVGLRTKRESWQRNQRSTAVSRRRAARGSIDFAGRVPRGRRRGASTARAIRRVHQSGARPAPPASVSTSVGRVRARLHERILDVACRDATEARSHARQASSRVNRDAGRR